MRMAEQEPQDFSEMINAVDAPGWNGAMGMKLVRATRDEVIAELTVGPIHHQAYGIVHGGVYAGVIEAVASIGAAINVMPEGKSAVGLENHTSFLRAVRSGKLRAVAKPLTRGRTSHVWEGSVYDEQGKLAATGRVRLQVLEANAAIAGAKVDLPGSR
jgi:uncharacterized protein (TIGR00369 family)